MTRRWRYHGDVNIEHGGTFIDFREWRNGYVDCVEVTDLDSACGARGMILVESRSITLWPDTSWPSALGAIGAKLVPTGIDDNGRTLKRGTLAYRWCLAYALNAYGRYDTDRSEVLQPDYGESVDFYSFHAIRVRSVMRYIRREFLGYSR